MHRDLKPSNILIDKDKKVLICDYGQTRVDLEGFPDKNEEIQNMIQNLKYTLDIGSRWYKAPELLFGCRKYRKSIDIWSLGCILAELLLKT
jgi:serine/threonine protein kinase